MPAVQGALNTAWGLSFKMSPVMVMPEWTTRTAFVVLSEDENGVKVEPGNPQRIRECVFWTLGSVATEA